MPFGEEFIYFRRNRTSGIGAPAEGIFPVYGPQTETRPSGAVDINVGDTWQTVVNGQSAGTTFWIKAGTHRNQTVAVRAGDTYIGEYGAIMSGARNITAGVVSWTLSGSQWFITGQTQSNGTGPSFCFSAYPMCGQAEDLWMDGVLKTRVATLAECGAGEWFFDLAADRIYVGDNPNLATIIETGVTQYAFTGTAANVTIKNLVIEKYACHAQTAPVGEQTGAGSGWTISRNEFSNNHGMGLRLGHTMTATRNYIHHNGQMGMGGTGDDCIVNINSINYNNVQFDFGWEGGGTKFVNTNRLILRENFVSFNIGPGLWLDINNDAYLIEDNTVQDNHSNGFNASSAGIFIEISGGGVIRNNTIERNGFGWTGDDWLFGAGIVIAASGRSAATTVPDFGPVTGIEIYGNDVLLNLDGIALIQQPRPEIPPPWGGEHLVENVYAHDNTVRMAVGLNGAVTDSGSNAIFLSRNNRFENNFYFTSGSTNFFAWDNAQRTFASWQTYGHDDTGSCTVF